MTDQRLRPTERPPTDAEIAYDMEARAKKLDEMSRQLARESADMFFAAQRIRERAK